MHLALPLPGNLHGKTRLANNGAATAGRSQLGRPIGSLALFAWQQGFVCGLALPLADLGIWMTRGETNGTGTSLAGGSCEKVLVHAIPHLPAASCSCHLRATTSLDRPAV